MAFWGVEVKPGKPFVLGHEDVNRRLLLSQATLGIGSSSKKSILQCQVGDGDPIFLCTLLPDKFECCQLNLEFEEHEDVKFSVVGPTSIHLSGIVHSANEDDDEDYEDDEDDWDSDAYSVSEDDDDDDPFGEDDIDMFPTSPAQNSGVIIEEIEDDDNPKDGNVENKQGKSKTTKLLESGNKDESHQIVAKGSAAAPMLESEDEDGFPVSSSQRIKPHTQKLEANNDADEPMSNSEKKKKKKADLMKGDGSGAKRKAGPVVDENRKRGSIPVTDSSLPPEAVLGESISEPKKKKKKRNDGRVAKEHGTTDKCKSDAEEDQTAHDPELVVANDSNAANGRASDEPKKKKKKKKNGKNKDTDGLENEQKPVATQSDKNTSVTEGSKISNAKPSKVREYPNGLVIEELEMGKPDGKRASPGKKVKVRYIGKLRKNGQIFDSNIGRAPFQFRLGIGSVIKGWDVGVEGMRVGDRRRLTIPPEMGYGAKGAPPKIPQNSWLVFDVELVDVA